MTSVNSSPGGNAAHSSQLSKLLAANKTADNDDSSGTGRPAAVSKMGPSLASVLSTDDTKGVGAKATSIINSLMMGFKALKVEDQQESGAVSGHSRHRGAGGAQEAAKAFAKIDTDRNGSVSLAEFVAGRPKGMSEEDATKIFKSIDTKGTGSISKEQFAAHLKAEHEKAGGAHHTKDADAADSHSDMKALTQDLMTKLKEVIQTVNNG